MELIDEVSGKTVMTADHANLIGERGFPIPIQMYGHPENFAHPHLLTVPWIEVSGDRRNISKDDPLVTESIDESVIEKRLSSLGYR